MVLYYYLGRYLRDGLSIRYLRIFSGVGADQLSFKTRVLFPS